MRIDGEFNSALVKASIIDEATISQIKEMCEIEDFKDNNIVIMPDCHAGCGVSIGTTMTINSECINPEYVGVDIGCGVLSLKLKEKSIDLNVIDKIANTKIASGTSIYDKAFKSNDLKDKLNSLIAKVDVDRALKSVGSLGGGNHFLEINEDENGNKYLSVHTGSRHLGVEVCKFYTSKMVDNNYKEKAKEVIEYLKKEKREKEIEKTLIALREVEHRNVNNKFVKGIDFKNYIHDMKITQYFAKVNREELLKKVANEYFKETGVILAIVEEISTIHNYIDLDNNILRKGAVSAQKGEKLIIPMNMRDGSLVCIGKGNKDWNFSAPHGAGRIMSRNAAFKAISLEDFKKSMDGIYTTSVCDETIDEAPMAYKSADIIKKDIESTVEIIEIIKPIYNFKAKG